ncbi:MAG: hypothetical protein KatS3mg044_0342 [Rhodothermaceae bacterium]|nr:MAG: hypothetical protein KatS3mg044_0342 [Rhodothermaceae bacterium]
MPVRTLFAPARVFAVWLLAAWAGGCAYYSFTGASIPSHLRTIAIPLAEDRSVSTVTALDEQLTRLLIDRFVGQTRLVLEPDPESADAVLTATIDRYANAPTAVGAEERTTRNRVTITVTVVYEDRVEGRELLRRSFQGFDEYDPVADGLAGEETAALAALEKIADDIFTAATSNW